MPLLIAPVVAQSSPVRRVYALTEASKYVSVIFGILVASSVATGLWLVSVPSATGSTYIQLSLSPSDFPVQPFKCPTSLSTLSEHAYSPLLRPPSGPIDYRSCSPVSIVNHPAKVRNSHVFVDLIAIVCIVVFALKHRSNHGQSRMTRLMRTILQDSVLYFLVMAGIHIAMVFFTFFARVTTLLPPSEREILIPCLLSLPFRVSHRSRSSCTYSAIPIKLVD